MPDDPFADTGVDRTVMMPMPGGRLPPGRPATPEGREAPGESPEEPAVTTGLNPLVAAANPLLNAIPQIRATVQHPDPTALRERLAQGIRQFEARARAAGISSEKIIAARYALCTLVDETAASTPWGASGAWAQQGLLALFHQEVGGGERFFQLLARLAENPQANLDVLDLMYLCLQLGFEGRYRVVEGGQRQLEAIRQRLLSIIRKQHGEYERDLAPNWRGVAGAAQPRLGWLPLWAVGAVTALLLVGIFLGFRLSLERASDAIAEEISAIRVAPQVPSARPPRRAVQPRLAPFLAEEIRRDLVAVDDRADQSVVTILGDGLFRPGEATVQGKDKWLLARIGDALGKVEGQVDVIGHTDNVPIFTPRFPSNWELSKGRAESVAHLLASRVPAERLRAQGRGAGEPVAPNDTPQGRARNRRVEITLHVPAGAPPPAEPARPPRKP